MSRGHGWRHGYHIGPKFIQKIGPETQLQHMSKGPSRSQATSSAEPRGPSRSRARGRAGARHSGSITRGNSEAPGLSLNGAPDLWV